MVDSLSPVQGYLFHYTFLNLYLHVVSFIKIKAKTARRQSSNTLLVKTLCRPRGYINFLNILTQYRQQIVLYPFHLTHGSDVTRKRSQRT